MNSGFKRTLSLATAFLILTPALVMAAEGPANPVKNTTLWDLLKAGGWAMVALAALSVATLACVIYNYLTLRAKNLIPADFTETLVMRLEAEDLQGAQFMCEKKKNVISTIALAGLSRRTRGKAVIRESIDNAARREIGKLWQNISYLGDIATIAPLLGLFGTVIGMIHAFSVISTAGSSLKPLMIVGGISQALVATAGGLVVAIPALAFYSYFRGQVQELSEIITDETADLTKLIEEPGQQTASRVNEALV